MFREMRRKKQQVSDDACVKVLRETRRGVLAVQGEGGYPYALPVNFLYDEDDGKIYIHCAREGHKIDAIMACDKVCFTAHNEGYRDEGDWAYHVTSVIVFGRAELMADEQERLRAARRFGAKYYPTEEELDQEMEHAGKRVQMIAITPEHMTGKLVYEK